MLVKLKQWLEAQDKCLDRFNSPVPLTEVSREIGETSVAIRAFLHGCEEPIFHIWEHQHRTRSKPYCLHLSGPADVCLDREDSIIGAAEAVFQQPGYTCRREIGSEEHLSLLCKDPSLDPLEPGSNLRDLWALKKDGCGGIDLFILEAKGKQAGPFDFYCFAEALGQVFPVRACLLSIMLGTQKERDGHGYCWSFARRLHKAWTDQGFQPTITVGLILPEWSPDVVWTDRKARVRKSSYFARPLTHFWRFLANGEATAEPDGRKSKAQAAFQQMLHEVEANVKIRSLAKAETGLRFRLVTAQHRPDPFYFRLTGLE